MPRDASHRLLAVIAAQTGLTMAEVQAELCNRAIRPGHGGRCGPESTRHP